VGLRTIETGGKELAQRQSLRGLQRFTLTAKVPVTRLFGGHLPREIAAASDPRSTQRRTSRDAMKNTGGSSDPSVPLSATTAEESGDNDSARPALHPA
jgi:hypothetical protein